MTGPAPAKINLALVVGPRREDGKHELATVYQRIDLGDRITVVPADATTVEGFREDTIVRSALEELAAPHGWRVRIEKHVPVAAGLGGGSSDAATALRLANEQLDEPRPLREIAARVGADVPFFLHDGPQLGTGDGTMLEPLDLPQDFVVLLLLPNDVHKRSTAHVYDDFDARGGEEGYANRISTLRATLANVRRPRDLAALPPNDLATSPLADELRAHGAFRADVSGAGPAVYGLFGRVADARRAGRALRRRGRYWVTIPAWYG
ncbi:MAG: 4-(cytidine 5'-diphospho)-2-C-methyl-D-erythritol kinase [Gaiellaceae bacterium]